MKEIGEYEKKNAFLRKKVAFVLIFLSRNPMHLEYEEYIRRKFGNIGVGEGCERGERGREEGGEGGREGVFIGKSNAFSHFYRKINAPQK